MEPVASIANYEDGWKISGILKKDYEQEEQGENKREQFFRLSRGPFYCSSLHFIAQLMPVE